VLGVHKGIIHYTIGQRKGLGITSPVPLYVIAIREDEDAIVVGSKEDLGKTALIAHSVNFISIPELDRPMAVKAKIRYKAPEAPAMILPMQEGRVKVEFEHPQSAITPGQAVVFYDGDVVVGGGTIETSL
jgi:tRNA-specific 2-thiouridylase